ncbi:MAG: histidine--tRNA ligase, partial [Gammaproteobacteria bacterium]|nr:histidine--tRNA ligase [Gammaproteobacteria bacterium]
AAYRDILVEYFSAHRERLDEDSQRRLTSNPLRILDSKNPEMQTLIEAAPKLAEHLDVESREHFTVVCATLDAAGVTYRVNPRLVRGLDYYGRTVFEWVTDRLGSQGTVCAGGRYDGLVEFLGGRSTPAFGFALGLERLIALLIDLGVHPQPETAHAYLVLVGMAAERQGPVLGERLRDAVPGLRLQVNCGGGSFKSQFKRADRSGAAWALILGEDEAANGRLGIKSLRGEAAQEMLSEAEAIARLQALVAG